MIVIKETETNYLLSIPITQKERAKKIVPRTWDPKRSVWVYPKTKKIYEELIAEFGEDDIQVLTIKEQIKPSIGELVQESDDNKFLTSQVKEIIKNLEKFDFSSKSREEENIKSLLNQIENLSECIRDITDQLIDKDKEIDDLRKKNLDSQEQITKLRQLLENKENTAQDIELIIKERAKESTSNDNKFCKVIDQNKIGVDLLLDINNKMFTELKMMLNSKDNEISLSDIINQASDAELLSSEAKDYAHLIRKERNKIVHDNVYSKTREARIIMCLFAAALLWPNFPE